MSDREKAVAILAKYVFEADDGALHLNGDCDPAEPLVRAIADAISAGREAGMREAAEIVYARLPPGEADSWHDGWLCGIEAASAAILSAIGKPKK